MMKKRKGSGRGKAKLAATPSKPTVVYFSAPWCAPCKAFGPLVEKLAKETGVTVVKVDVDDPPEAYKDEAALLRSVPALSWVGDRPGTQRLMGAVGEVALRNWMKAGVEDSKR